MIITHDDEIKAAIFGTVVGDALGVPVEFSSKHQRKEDPVTDMREYGTHNQPMGTWSDDSSMMLATIDSIVQKREINFEDIMNRFGKWLHDGEYTPHGKTFDYGMTCANAITKYHPGVDPRECGGCNEHDNGNGSLMRIIPISLNFALESDYDIDYAVDKVHDASRLTHGHPRSLIGCMIYTSICHELIFHKGIYPLLDIVQRAVDDTLKFYERAAKKHAWFSEDFESEVKVDAYARLRDLDAFKNLPNSEIRGSGYVVDCLEASVWCLLNSESYSDCVLKAVNLGEDTDTTGAVAGGLAGIFYGYDDIPKEWIDVIVKKDWINKLVKKYTDFWDAEGVLS